jgi:hypothetical protein
MRAFRKKTASRDLLFLIIALLPSSATSAAIAQTKSGPDLAAGFYRWRLRLPSELSLNFEMSRLAWKHDIVLVKYLR